MVVGISVFELHIPGARSLKHKRKVVKSLIERIHHRFRVSVAETDFHDLHQRAEIGLAAVTRTETDANQLLDRVRDLIDEETETYLVRWDPQLLDSMT